MARRGHRSAWTSKAGIVAACLALACGACEAVLGIGNLDVVSGDGGEADGGGQGAPDGTDVDSDDASTSMHEDAPSPDKDGTVDGPTNKGDATDGEIDALDGTADATNDAADAATDAVDAADGAEPADATVPDSGEDAAPAFDAYAEEAGTPCEASAECGYALNCIASACAAAPTNCATLKSLLADAGDGVYWIAPSADGGIEDAATDGAPGVPIQAYCDMQLGQDICDQELGTHQGQMRDGSGVVYQMTSVLDGSVCTFKNMETPGSAEPFALPISTNQVCGLMGFTGKLITDTGCSFGPGFGSCGFDVVACATDAGNGYEMILSSPPPYHVGCATGLQELFTGGTCNAP